MQLEKALQIPGLRDGSDPRIKIGERAGVFVELVGALAELSRFKEAHRLAREAKGIFRRTAAELQIILAESDLAVKRHEIDSAIQMLNKVPSESPAFAQAQAAKAEIYLNHRHDRRAYAQCYLDLVEAKGDSAAFIQLGDAYMRIQSPEAAVEALVKALALNPTDSALAARIGRALVSTHDYKRAIDYYSGALAKDPGSGELCLDLSRLFLRLNRLSESMSVLGPQLARIDENPGTTLDDVAQTVQTLLLLADIHKHHIQVDEQQAALERAHRHQKRLVEHTKVQVHGPEVAEAQRATLASICCSLATLREEQKDISGAEDWLREALQAQGTNQVALEALCDLYFRRKDYEACRRQCQVLERVNSESALAQMLLADILFIERKEGEATAKYKELLRKHPNHYRALRRLVTLLERAGQLKEASQFLQRAEKANPRAFSHAGLNFCRGMFHRASNNVHEAIRFFNFARRDGEWGTEALANMIELYLNPDNDNAWATGQGVPEGHEEAVRIAERFIQELRAMAPTPLPAQYRVLELYILLGQYQVSTKRSEDADRSFLDQAEKGFIDILEEDRDNIPANLGLSTVFLLSQNQNKARNMLKRIAKLEYDHHQSREFERTYLHLADIYIEKGKNDVAIDLCKKALEHNKSCEKAWEYIGIIHEKELSYKDAADAYEKAWQCANEASASIGFRLAFNYLKARRFVEAVDVCSKVLKQFPDYPKMKEEILDKAVQSLRP